MRNTLCTIESCKLYKVPITEIAYPIDQSKPTICISCSSTLSKFACTGCAKSFKSKQMLGYHLKNCVAIKISQIKNLHASEVVKYKTEIEVVETKLSEREEMIEKLYRELVQTSFVLRTVLGEKETVDSKMFL